MGTSRSFAEFNRKLGRLQAEYRDLPLAVVKESSLLVKTAVLAAAKPASGGDLRLSGVGRRGGRVGVRYDVNGQGDTAKSRVFVTGPFHLMERDTAAGVRPRQRRKGRGKNRFVGPVAGYYHPGTPGKHPFAVGVATSAPLVRQLFAARNNLALRRIF